MRRGSVRFLDGFDGRAGEMVAEILAAVGLTLSRVARIHPWLVSCAAAGVMIVMICATVFSPGAW